MVEPVRGYKIEGDPHAVRELSYEYLKLKPEASRAKEALDIAVRDKGANCLGREDDFSGETLPSDREADALCLGCPSKPECKIYAMLARPAWGVHNGHVYGRDLEDIEND